MEVKANFGSNSTLNVTLFVLFSKRVPIMMLGLEAFTINNSGTSSALNNIHCGVPQGLILLFR